MDYKEMWMKLKDNIAQEMLFVENLIYRGNDPNYFQQVNDSIHKYKIACLKEVIRNMNNLEEIENIESDKYIE